jgi:hypothetical protein
MLDIFPQTERVSKLYILWKFLLLRVEVPTAVNNIIAVFWDVTHCRLVDGFQRFGETYCHPLQRTSEFLPGGWSVSLKRR